ncbi:MAG: YceI family protein [Mameliella sp.]|nr:YceI family protein [Phaeodactylibacter sp.]
MDTANQTKTKWAIDTDHSEIHFKVKHMMVSTVTGAFNEFEGSVEAENDDFSGADIAFSANISSIDTKNSQRDEHLKSDDFFNAEAFPVMSFKSKSFTKKDEESYVLIGELTIRDNTHEVTLDTVYNGTAVDPYGQTKAGFEITGKINRKTFGLKWGAVTEAGGVVVSDQVKLDLNIQLVKQ